MNRQPGPPETEVEWNGQSLSGRILRPRTLLSFILAIGIVAIALSRFDLDIGSVVTQMRQANMVYLLGAFAVYYGSFALRAARWNSLLASAGVEAAPGRRLPGIPTMMLIYLLSWFANCLVPAKLGDAYRGFLLKSRAGTSFGAALGTIFAERLADLVTLAIVLIGSGLLVFHGRVPARIENWLFLALFLGVLLVVGVVVLYRFRLFFRGFVPARVKDHYVRMEEGALGSFGRLPTLIGLTAIIWLTEGIRLYLVGLSIDSGLSFGTAVFISLFASLLTAIPVTPAGLGFVELGVVSVLTLMGVGEATSATLVFLDRFVAYWSVILIGAVAYLATRWLWR